MPHSLPPTLLVKRLPSTFFMYPQHFRILWSTLSSKLLLFLYPSLIPVFLIWSITFTPKNLLKRSILNNFSYGIFPSSFPHPYYPSCVLVFHFFQCLPLSVSLCINLDSISPILFNLEFPGLHICPELVCTYIRIKSSFKWISILSLELKRFRHSFSSSQNLFLSSFSSFSLHEP